MIGREEATKTKNRKTMIKRFFNHLALAASMLLTRFDIRLGGLTGAANTEPDNYDANVMVHHESVRRTNDSAIATRHLLWKKGAADNTVDIAGASDLPLGTIDNIEPGTAMGESLLLLGKGPTKKMVIASAVNVGVRVFTAASGQVSALSGTTGTYYQVGVSLTGGNTAGDVIEVLDQAPVAVAVA